MRNSWDEHFTFTKKERTGIIVLIVLIAISIILPYLFSAPQPVADKATFEQLKQQLAQLQVKRIDSTSSIPVEFKSDSRDIVNASRSPILFVFDPNTLPPQDWKRLGITDRTVRTIQHYLAKGGHFRKPEDLGKVYGLRQDIYQRLLPYVRISMPSAGRKQADTFSSTWRKNNYAGYSKHTVAVIDINAADTTAFIALPGIGSKLAQRIINFREKLGGFYSVEQVAETYALPDSTFQLIKNRLQCEAPVVKKININTADVNTLRQHPYIKWNLANAIVQYRQQHGPFKAVQELTQIDVITPDIFGRIAPYLTIE